MSSANRASAYVILAGVSSLVVWLWAEWHPADYIAELTVASSVPATSQVFCDLGRGFNETDSATADIPGGDFPVTCRFVLPQGTCRALRFDPINCAGSVTFSGMRILGPDGRVLRVIAASDFHPAHQIARSTVAGQAVRMVTEPGVDDPYYAVALSGPLFLQEGAARCLLRASGRFVIIFLLGLGLVAFGRGFRRRYPSCVTNLRTWAGQCPHASLATVAAVAAVLASYPLVFCGRSLVSPNNSTVLLYDTGPTVPGVADLRRSNVHGADIGALMWQHLPYTVMQHRALFHDGELPLWNRYDSCGLPLLGQGQSMFGDPLHLPELLAGGAAWAFDLRFVLCKFLFAAGLGFTVWVAVGSLPAAALVAFASAFVGFFNFRFNHPAIFSVSVAPWVLLCWVRLVRASTRRAAAAWSAGLILANGSLLASGTVKEGYMLVLCLNLAGGLALVLAPTTPLAKWRKLALAAAAGMVLILLTAPVWMTFQETLRAAMTSSDQPLAWQVPWNRLIGLFDDLFYRELSAEHVVVAPSLNFVLLLGVLWFCACLPRFRQDSLALVLAVGALGAISLVFAWVPGSLIVRLPVLRHVVHIANTFSCVAMVFLAVLAGYGFAAARQALADARWWRPALVTLLLLAGLVLGYFHGMAYYWSGRDAFREWLLIVPAHRLFFEYLALMLAAVVTLTLVAAWCLRRRQLPALAVFAALLAAGLLLARNGLHYSTDYRSDYFTTPAVRADLQAPSAAVNFMKTAAGGQPFRAVGTANNLFPGFTAVYGIEGINGPDAVMNPAYTELLLAAGLLHSGDWRVVLPPPALARSQPVLDLLNVRFCVAEPYAPPPAGTYRRLARLDLAVYASPTVWPRAFFTDTVVPCPDVHDFLSLVDAAAGRPFAAIAEGDLPAQGVLTALSRDLGARRVVPATDYRLTNNTTSFTVRAPGAGVVVLEETYIPGDFRVTINGRPAHCFRVNQAFKGVAIAAAGTYRVTFTYRPRHWTASLAMAGTGLVLLALGLLGLRRAEKNSGHQLPIRA